MPRRLLLLVLAATLAPASLCAQEGGEPSATTQEETPAPEPEKEKKPDAFQYFFGRKEKVPSKAAEPAAEAAPPEVPAEPVAAVETTAPAAPVPAADSSTPAPTPKVPFLEMRFEPEPVPEPNGSETSPETAKPEPKVDAFQYFFGRSAQSAPQARSKKEESVERKPVDAFEYFFGKEGKAGDAGESEEVFPKPPRR